jgi:hypothetical protein
VIRDASLAAKPVRFTDLPRQPITVAEGAALLARWRAAWPDVSAALERLSVYVSAWNADPAARGQRRPDLVPATRGGNAVLNRRDAAIMAARLPGRPS